MKLERYQFFPVIIETNEGRTKRPAHQKCSFQEPVMSFVGCLLLRITNISTFFQITLLHTEMSF